MRRVKSSQGSCRGTCSWITSFFKPKTEGSLFQFPYYNQKYGPVAQPWERVTLPSDATLSGIFLALLGNPTTRSIALGVTGLKNQTYGPVAQPGRASPLQGGGRGFETAGYAQLARNSKAHSTALNGPNNVANPHNVTGWRKSRRVHSRKQFFRLQSEKLVFECLIMPDD